MDELRQVVTQRIEREVEVQRAPRFAVALSDEHRRYAQGLDADAARGGPNKLSLNQARQNYAEFRASDRSMLKHVRTPKAEE